MEWTTFILIMGGILVVLLAGGVWISLALAATGCMLLLINGYPLGPIGSIYWTQAGNFVLVAVPLFILMGEIILNSGISARFYKSITPWARFLPGKLYSVNIVASGIFAAVSGSSVATAAAIGSVAIPELRQRGYADRLNYGTIAAGGTLGILIPPSAGLIIYGSLVSENIAKLFIAGIVPGLVLILLFIAWVTIVSIVKPGTIPPETEPMSLAELGRSLPGLLPILLLILTVIGGIYSGFVTPTEAAALGVMGSIVIGATVGNLTFRKLWDSGKRSVISTAMIMFIVLGAQVLSYALARTGTSRELVAWVTEMSLTPWGVFAIIAVIYLVLGCFIDAISIMVLTLPLVHPVIVALGFDSLWFGIVLTMLIEVGMITPPVGLNLFVIQNFAGKKGAYGEITAGSMPFVVLILIGVILVCFFPALALWLPAHL